MSPVDDQICLSCSHPRDHHVAHGSGIGVVCITCECQDWGTTIPIYCRVGVHDWRFRGGVWRCTWCKKSRYSPVMSPATPDERLCLSCHHPGLLHVEATNGYSCTLCACEDWAHNSSWRCWFGIHDFRTFDPGDVYRRICVRCGATRFG